MTHKLRKQGLWNIVHKPCFNRALKLSYLAFRQHIQHDLCTKLESKAKRLAIGYHIDFPLGGHVVLEYFLLLFGERVGQSISGSDKLIPVPHTGKRPWGAASGRFAESGFAVLSAGKPTGFS